MATAFRVDAWNRKCYLYQFYHRRQFDQNASHWINFHDMAPFHSIPYVMDTTPKTYHFLVGKFLQLFPSFISWSDIPLAPRVRMDTLLVFEAFLWFNFRSSSLKFPAFDRDVDLIQRIVQFWIFDVPDEFCRGFDVSHIGGPLSVKFLTYFLSNGEGAPLKKCKDVKVQNRKVQNSTAIRWTNRLLNIQSNSLTIMGWFTNYIDTRGVPEEGGGVWKTVSIKCVSHPWLNNAISLCSPLR